jgi:hypothetical protein
MTGAFTTIFAFSRAIRLWEERLTDRRLNEATTAVPWRYFHSILRGTIDSTLAREIL